jgi:O-antigen/teichoic acid export membrane protein
MARAVSQQLVFRALGMAASVLTVAATTRYLGPSHYGELTTAVMFVGLWTSLTELGVGATIVRRVMSGRGNLERLVRVNAGMSFVYCLPLFAIAAASGALVYRDQTDVVEMVLIVSCSLILSTIASCFEPIFLATVRFAAVAVSDLVSRVASLGATMVLLTLQANVVWFAAVQLVPPLVVLVIQGVAAARITDWRPIFCVAESWQLLRESLPLTAITMIAYLYWRADGVILSIRSTPEQVGVYGLALALAFTPAVLATFFQSSTLSAMTHSFARDRDEFAHFVTRSVESMLFVGAPVAVVGAILAGPVIELIGSTDFVQYGGPTLALLAVALSLTFLTGAISQALFAAHDQVFLLRLSVVNLIGNILLNIVLAPHYGAVGAAIALLAAETIGTTVATWRLGRLVPYGTPWPFTLRLLIPLAASAGVAVSMRHFPVLITIPVAAVVYVAINLIIGPVTVKVIKATLAEAETSGSTPASEET